MAEVGHDVRMIETLCNAYFVVKKTQCLCRLLRFFTSGFRVDVDLLDGHEFTGCLDQTQMNKTVCPFRDDGAAHPFQSPLSVRALHRCQCAGIGGYSQFVLRVHLGVNGTASTGGCIFVNVGCENFNWVQCWANGNAREYVLEPWCRLQAASEAWALLFPAQELKPGNSNLHQQCQAPVQLEF